jgi:hypothetical protein
MIIKKCVVCKTNIAKYGDTCSLECGKKFQQNNVLKNFGLEKINNKVNNGVYSNEDINFVNEIKKEIVKFKTLPQEQKLLFFKNTIKLMVKEIDGDRLKWNAICTHLKNNYSNKPENKFIIDAFKSIGMSIY